MARSSKARRWRPSRRRAAGPLLACFRALSAAVVLAFFVRPRHIRWRPMLVPFVVSFASMNVLYVTAMTRTTAAAAVFLQYTGTGWAFLLSALVLGERLGRRTPGGSRLRDDRHLVDRCGRLDDAELWRELAGPGQRRRYGGVVVSLKWLRDEDSAWLVALCHAAAGIILLPRVLAADAGAGSRAVDAVVLFGVVQMGLPYVIFARALRASRPRKRRAFTLIEPITNPIWVLLSLG